MRGECSSKDLQYERKNKLLKDGSTDANTPGQSMPISELDFGRCRFCSAEGEHRNMAVDHMLAGKCENYSVMLLESFNIFISMESASSLICSACVSRLRDAHSFRMLVVRAEQGLLRGQENVQVGINQLPERVDIDIKPESKEPGPAVKTEPVEVQIEPDIDMVEHEMPHPSANELPDEVKAAKEDTNVKKVSVEIKIEPDIDIVEHGPPESKRQRLEDYITNKLDAFLLERLKSDNNKDDEESNTDRNNAYGCSPKMVEIFLEEYNNGQDDVEEETENIEFTRDVEMPANGSDSGVIDLEEENAFLATGCDCRQKCLDKFNRNEVLKSRLDCLDLDFYCEHHTNHLNLMTLGALSATANTGPDIAHSHSKLRQRNHIKFMYRGLPVCRKFFLFAHGLGMKKFKNILKRFQENGVEGHVHNGVKLPYLPLEQRSDEVSFINNFSLSNSLVLPGRSQVKNMDLHILPSCMNRTSVYEQYVGACKQVKKQPISRALWYKCWDKFCPNIVTQNLTDTCYTCKDFASAFARAKSEDTKARILKEALDHANFVQEQRSYYQNIISLPPVMVDVSLGPHTPCSYEALVHYSFDYLQEVSLPQFPEQAGPLQFLNGYKVSLFGVAVEPLHKFVLYTIPESCISEGLNIVVSLLHHFFENFALGETEAVCHAGSTNQNKNNVLIQYAVWRVMSKLHKSFQLSFLPDGHAKFAPDIYFGLFKKKFRESIANSLMDVCQIAVSADKSKSTIGVIVNQTGDIHINTYDWTKYFSDNSPTPIPELPSWLHFKTETRNSGHGSVMCSNSPNDYANIVPVFDAPFGQKMPNILPPQGLSFERQKYLYENVRSFVSPEFRDCLCPIPQEVYILKLDPIIEKDQSVDSSDPLKPDIDTPLDPLDLLDTKDEKNYKGVEDKLESTPKANNTRNSPICSYCGLVGHRNQIRQGRYFCKKRQLDSEASTSH